MKEYKRNLFLFAISVFAILAVSAKESMATLSPVQSAMIIEQVAPGENVTVQFVVYFPLNSYEIDSQYMGNAESLSKIDETLKSLGPNNISSIEVVTLASPEGTLSRNNWLTQKRSEAIKNYFAKKYPTFKGKLKTKEVGEDWDELRQQVKNDKNLSEATKSRILKTIDSANRKTEIKKLGSDSKVGDIYEYLAKTYYPSLRKSDITLELPESLEEVSIVKEEPVVKKEEPVVKEEPIAKEEPVAKEDLVVVKEEPVVVDEVVEQSPLTESVTIEPSTINSQFIEGFDTLMVKKKVHVAFRDKDSDQLLGGISYVDMEELLKKDYTMSSLEDLYALVGGWNGNNLWGMDNERLDNNDNSNLPLVIIDGVKRPSNNVLPSEIEQVTFLKGAQAVVLYGSKGAKGAILITTKRGKVDGLQIDANANTGYHVAKAFPEYLGSAEYMTLYNEACMNDQLATGARYSQMDIYNHAAGLNPYRYPNVNYYSDEYVRKAYNRSEGTIEIQGGGARAHFYTNINYYRLEDLLNFGVAKKNYTDRFSVRGNVDLVINRFVKGYANASATFYNANKNKGDFWGEAATMRPNFPENAAPLIPIDWVDPNASKALAILNKSLNLLDGKYFPGGTKATTSNAIADCYFGGKTRDVSRQFQFDAGFSYDMDKFVRGLSFKTLFSIDYAANYSLSYDNKYAVFIPTWSNYNAQDAIVGITQQGDELITGHMAMSNSAYRQTISWNGHFDYDHTFDGGHHVTGMLLANMYTTTASGTYHRYANANLGLQAGYDYRGRYFADVTLAGVHSARLPKGNREAISPSFTLGWNIAREGFMEGSFVDDLLLSASYSDLNEDIDVYMGSKYFYLYDALWSTASSGFTWNEGASTDRTFSTMGSNPVLDFIHRKETSVSLRGSFFKRLIATDLTFFNTDMSGFIIQNPSLFPSHLQGGLSGGSFKPAINNNIQNRKGLDFSVTAQKQLGKVHATLGVVGTYLTTNWKKYDETIDPTATNKYTEGQALDALWGYKCLGFYTSDDFDITTTNEGKTKYTLKDGLPRPAIGGNIQPGDLKYEDVNNDGTINNKDMVVLGNSGNIVFLDSNGNPSSNGMGSIGAPMTMGVNLTLKYRNFTLFALGNGQFGAYALKNNSYYYMERESKYSVNARGRWTPETADVATHPRLTTYSSANNAAASTFWLYSTDRFNIRKVQLTYDFPKEKFEGKAVEALSIYLNGNDLLTISKNRKIMETSVGYAPQTRFYNLGVKVTL